MDEKSKCKVCNKQVENQNVCSRCDKFTDKTNRSVRQTKFLLDLLDGNFNKLLDLEEKIKNNLVFYCPADLESVEKILKLSGVGNFNLNEFKS